MIYDAGNSFAISSWPFLRLRSHYLNSTTLDETALCTEHVFILLANKSSWSKSGKALPPDKCRSSLRSQTVVHYSTRQILLGDRRLALAWCGPSHSHSNLFKTEIVFCNLRYAARLGAGLPNVGSHRPTPSKFGVYLFNCRAS